MNILDWLNSNQGVVTAILTALNLFAMTIIMIKANRLSHKNIEQAREIELERAKPHLIFDIVVDNMLVYTELRNEGLSSARNVIFKVTPDLNSEQRNGKPLAFTQRPMSFIAPGKKLRDFVAVGHHFFKVYPDPIFVCEVSYEDSIGRKLNETFYIDVNYLKNIITITSPEVGKELEKVRKELESIRKTIKGVSSNPLQIALATAAKNDESTVQ